jgi:hypothetical protein
MPLFIVPNGKNIGDETSGDRLVDAVVCYRCFFTDYYDMRMDDAETESYIQALDPAPVGSSCWLCSEIDTDIPVQWSDL